METTNKSNDMIPTITVMPQAADSIRRTQLQRLSDFSEAEGAAEEIELKRVAGKYGAVSPQAMAAAARLERLHLERASIRAEMVRQAIPTPESRPGSFVVYGRVLNPEGDALRRVTVIAVDTNGANLAKAVTGNLDVFQISIPVKKSTAVPKGGRTATERQEESATASVTFRLQISEPRSGLRFENDEVFQGVPDRLTYREIIVPKDAFRRAPKVKTASKTKRRA
jgi:hypothetical protein